MRSQLCFEIQMGMVDRGASLGWLSQYPHESEILFAPMTGLEVLGTRVEGGVIVVETRLSVNLTALTIEQVVSRRRKLCMDMCDSMQLELMHEVSQPKWAALKSLVADAAPLEGEGRSRRSSFDGAAGAFNLPGYAMSVLRGMLDETISYPPDHYNDESQMLLRIRARRRPPSAPSPSHPPRAPPLTARPHRDSIVGRTPCKPRTR